MLVMGENYSEIGCIIIDSENPVRIRTEIDGKIEELEMLRTCKDDNTCVICERNGKEVKVKTKDVVTRDIAKIKEE